MIGPGTEPLYAIIRTVSSRSRFLTGAIRSSSPCSSALMVRGSVASGSPAVSRENVSSPVAPHLSLPDAGRLRRGAVWFDVGGLGRPLRVCGNLRRDERGVVPDEAEQC